MASKKSCKQVRVRLHECQECHVRRMVNILEMNRAARPRCTACGSARLELVSEDAKADQRRLQARRVEGSGGSLELSGEEKDTAHRIVR